MKLTQSLEARLDLAFKITDISGNKRNFWISRLEKMPEEVQDQIIALFEMFPEEIEWMSAIQMRKERALESNDRQEWKEIVAEEENLLSDILSAKK